LRIRILGQSRNIDAPSNACLFATGNNLAVGGDMTRRTLLCSLDPKVERPELRTFSVNPLQEASKNRGAYVVAALTIMRAHHLADYPHTAGPLGSFEAWSRRVRAALIWVGAGDPCETIERARKSDPKLAARHAVIEQWDAVCGMEALTVRQLVKRAEDKPGLRDALMEVAGTVDGINNRRLGKWIARNRDRIVTIGDPTAQKKAKIEECGIRQGSTVWRIAPDQA
jgi:hypothetical protein